MEQKYKDHLASPIISDWLKQLREHPERQVEGNLGVRYANGNFKACCLGQLLVCAKGDAAFGPGGLIQDGVASTTLLHGSWTTYLHASWVEFALYDGSGVLAGRGGPDGEDSLAAMNDNSVPWPEIAGFIEQHPERVFNL